VIPQIRRLAWKSWAPIAQRAARAYVAGPTLGDAMRTCEAVAHRGFASTICAWNDDGDAWSAVADSYIASLRYLAGTTLDCYVSIKAPAIGHSREVLAQVIDVARSARRGLHFDSLAPEDAEHTWTLIEDAVARLEQVGCTLPGRWHRSASDAERAVGLGLRVRVVRGQWVDPGVPDMDSGQGFLALIDRLAGRARHVAVATHDPALAREALTRLKHAGTSCELELLYGLGTRNPLLVARAVGVPVRIYIPYGHAWLPYCLSQARKKPRILWWIMRDSLLSWAISAVPPAG
jgi:proline dehydrogenase